MANNITVAELFQNLVDESYKANSKVATIFNSGKIQPVGTGYGKFKVQKVSTDGIGTYDKTTGYSKSGVNVSFEEISPDIDLSTSISVDHYDDAESLNNALVYAWADIQDKLIREVDAISVASIVKQANTGNVVEQTITNGDEVVSNIRAALNVMDNKRVYNDKVLLATPEIIGALEDMDSYKSKAILGHFVDVIPMEKDIFYTGVDVGTGKDGDWNYKKSDNAKNINFMIVSKSAVDNSYETRAKFIGTEINPNFDADSMFLRFYAVSAYVFDNKKDGIFVSTAA